MCFNVLKLLYVSFYICRLVEVQISAGNLFQVTGAFNGVECVLGTIMGKKSVFKLFKMVMYPT